MKTRLTVLSLTLAVLAPSAFAHEVLPGAIAESALHRIERLVTLRRIDAGFQTKLTQIALEKLPSTDPEGPNFKVKGFQGVAADGTQRTVELVLDEDGRTLSSTQTTGGLPAAPVAWPLKDAVSLLEYSLHCIEGELIGPSRLCADDARLRAFNRGFAGAELSPALAADGSIVGAVVVISATGTAERVRIRFATDGSLAATDAIEFLPPPPASGSLE